MFRDFEMTREEEMLSSKVQKYVHENFVPELIQHFL